MPVDFSVTNQLASPAIYASSFATRPAASFKGRLFVDTDNPSTGIYRDTGTAWVAIAGTGVAETQNLDQVCTIGNTTTLGIEAAGDSAFGTSVLEGYALNVGESDAGGGRSINTDLDCTIAGINIGRGGSNIATNVSFGIAALQDNSTGELNTAIGNLAIYKLYGGKWNTAVGSNSGGIIESANGNTLLGYGTNVSNESDSYNLVIGYGAVAPTGSNQFVIGSNGQSAGTVNSEVNASTRVWNVVINGVARKILLA